MGLLDIVKNVGKAVTPWAPVLDIAGGLFTNASNRGVSARQMDFQERMSSTAHQREVADLRAAGLNPILSSKHGGAAAPSGSGVPMKNPMENLAQKAHSVAQLRRTEAEVENLDAMTALNAERAETEIANQNAINANTALTLERTNTQTNLTEQERIRIETAFAQLGKTRMEAIQAEAMADRAILQGEIDRSQVGGLLAWLERAKQLGLSPADALRMFQRRGRGRTTGGKTTTRGNSRGSSSSSTKKDDFNVLENF